MLFEWNWCTMGNINKTWKICLIVYYKKGHWEYMSDCRKKIFSKLMSLNMAVWVETVGGVY